MADRNIDLAFCIDETGSMGPYINQIKAHVISIVTDVLKDPSVDSLRVGLVGYRDHGHEQGDWPAVTQVTELTADIAAVTGAVNAMKPGGGGGAEAMTDGLFDLARLSWRPTAAKVAVLIADAPPHGVEGWQPSGCPCGEDWETQTENCREIGITIFTVGCMTSMYSAASEKVLSTVARRTGGQLFPLSQVADLVPLIIYGAKDSLARLVAQERLSTLIHEQEKALLSMSTGQARLAALHSLAVSAGISISSFTYEGDGKVEPTKRMVSLSDVADLVRCLHQAAQLPKGLFDLPSLDENLPLPGLHSKRRDGATNESCVGYFG